MDVDHLKKKKNLFEIQNLKFKNEIQISNFKSQILKIMARYIGPKTKIARKFGAAIYGDDKSFEKRKNQPPGQHGLTKEEVLKI